MSDEIADAIRSRQRILAEGAQGTLLDLDHGSYPFVTSSHPTIGGVMMGLGMGPQHIERVVGVVKAYQTRVGAGPMPTELLGRTGRDIAWHAAHSPGMNSAPRPGGPGAAAGWTL